MDYPINQIFQTIQGEGFYAGIPAIFIRLQGCSVQCSWCDTKYTWKKSPRNQKLFFNILRKKNINNTWASINYNILIKFIKNRKWSPKHVVITGGEPSIYNLKPLIYGLEQLGFQCQIETSGLYFINCSPKTWITVSPKLNISNHYQISDQVLVRANEIKFPIFDENDIKIIDILLSKNKLNKNCIISLQPISCDNNAIQVCINHCISRNWRLSVQMHKYINII